MLCLQGCQLAHAISMLSPARCRKWLNVLTNICAYLLQCTDWFQCCGSISKARQHVVMLYAEDTLM